MQVDSADFYERHWQERAGRLSVDQVKQDQIRRIRRMIPEGVRTILDVGCGDGAITNRLVEEFDVTAVDRSETALSFLDSRVHTIQADATRLPFPDRAFDLVLSAEMIEHLPDPVLHPVVAQLRRVARRYVLISVPNDERLRKRYTKCRACGHEYHAYLHFQSFNRRTLRALFSGATPLHTECCGVPDAPSIPVLRFLANRLGREYFRLPNEAIPCPACGKADGPPPRTLVHRALARVLRTVEGGLIRARQLQPKVDWLMMLFDETGATASEKHGA